MIDYVLGIVLGRRRNKAAKSCLFVRRTRDELFNAGMSKYIEECWFDPKTNRNVWTDHYV